MARLTWAPNAVADLRSIQTYIAVASLIAARSQVQRIRAAVRRLESFPESGRRVPELPSSGFREIIVGQYRVIYLHRAERNRVRVLAVIHGSRELPDIEIDE